MLRELACIEVDTEPPDEPLDESTMTDEEFTDEYEQAAQGDWEALGLDRLPDDFRPTTIEDLRDAA